ncbi:hypothetical protein SD80_012815 [Scytonema tolypothrichoides VB-61278]|nr:hypothetical protein SD80_012815 [Scytonema tolypothrichoides VB-61278]
MEEASGPFAHERNIFDLPALVTALEQEFLALSSDHTRWRSQFQATTVSAALRQFRSAVRDLGPLLADERAYVRLPVENLASGGAWVIDVASLPQRAAQAVIDHIVTELWQAKANGLIPHELPLVLLVDELNRWSQNGPTASRLAAIARDQRHRRFSVVGLAQQMSTLHPQLLANYDTLSLGTTRSAELAELVYSHLPEQIRARLARLPPGKRYLDMWPFQQPLLVELPFPSWLQEEGRNVVDIWRQRGMKGEEEALARRD